jgi:hypothetical protein
LEQTTFIGIDSRIWQALIAGGVVALGWLVNGARERADARRLREERLRDAHKALFAEIRDVCASLWSEGRGEAEAEALVARMRADPDFVPFIPRETHGLVFEAMLHEIDVLPRQTIDAIVAFYSLVRSIGALAEDMRGARYARLDPERRIAILEDYGEMRRRAFAYGQGALTLIAAYSEGGATAAEAEAVRLNSPDEARSGPARREG